MDTPTAGHQLNCRDCVHYYITFDANFRYGCRALGFKSQKLPIQEVQETSGEDCQFFSAKPKTAVRQLRAGI